MLIGVVAMGFGVRWYLRTPKGQQMVDIVSVRMPVFGPIVRSFTTARIVRSLGMLLSSSLPLLEVLGLIRASMNNHLYRELLEDAEDIVTRGEPITNAMESSGLIDTTVKEALRAGEQSGQIGSAMLTVAEFVDEENDQTVRTLTSIMEPFILMILGVVVGFIALSMFIPLFDLATMGG